MDNESNQIEIESLSREISQKSILIAQLQGDLYKMAQENTKLKKKLKAKASPKSKGKGTK